MSSASSVIPYNRNPYVINVVVSDFILTPLSCSYIINEVLKCLVYQNNQIPLPYSILKSMVNKKRSRDNSKNECDIKHDFTVSNHYRQASQTYDTLSETMTALIHEFAESSNVIEEVVIALGTVPQCPQQVYRITIPELTKSHLDRNHIDDCIKRQHKTLREIFLADAWQNSLAHTVNIVNTYVFLKKRQLHATNENSFFLPWRCLDFRGVVNKVTINLIYDKTKFLDLNCCNFEVFDEENAVEKKERDPHTEDRRHICGQWFGGKTPVRGFKDCFINKISASEFW